MIIENLFPTPVGFFRLEKGLTKAQKTFLLNQEQFPNVGNTTSKDRYLLQKKQMSSLSSFILKCADEYFKATTNPKTDVKLKVTQSWLNWTKPGQFHHKHAHPNSLISGCFYLNANKTTDKIFFSNETYKQIKFSPISWNPYNSDSWWYPVGENDLIFFPSNLVHNVEPVQGDETRISLAFNIFPEGSIGDEQSLTALYI